MLNFLGSLARPRAWRICPHQVKFAPVQQFPFDLLSRLQTDRRCQRDREIDVEFGSLPFWTDRLHF